MLGGRHPWRPRGSQLGWEKRLDESFQGGAAEPRGTDSHRAGSDWAQKMLCIIVPDRRTASPEFFFREFVHDGCRLDHSLSVSCTKEMHTKTKSKDAFPVTCVAWRFCREQSPRGFAALARLSYFARRTKTAMLLRLLFQKYKLELTTGIHAHSHEKWIHIFWVYRDYSNSLTLSNASELCRSWTSINHIQIDKEKENFVVACLRPSQAGIVKREMAFSRGSRAVTAKKCTKKGNVFFLSCFAMPSYCFFDFLVQIELLLLIASETFFRLISSSFVSG